MAKPSPQRFWTGHVPATDDFGEPIEHRTGGVFVDGKTRHGPWAFMTHSSWVLEGVGRLGPGYGQKYQRQADGRWLKVEG